MDNEQLHDICVHFDIERPISLPTKIEGGLLHLMWRVDTKKASYAIKELSKNIILTERVRRSYEISEKIAQLFYQHGIPSISAMEKDGKFLVDARGSTFIIYPWVNATILTHESITDYHVITIATLLAEMHLLNLSVPGMSSPNYDFNSNAEIISLIEQSLVLSLPFAGTLQALQSRLIEWNEKYQIAVAGFQSVSVISHADLDPKNVLWDENNKPVLIDWESARLINPSYELLIAALDWSGATTGSLNLQLFLSMINAYKNAGGVIDSEILNSNFYGIPGNAINWMLYNVSRSLKAENSIEEKVMGIDQVNLTIKAMLHIESKIEVLKVMIANQLI